MTVTTNYLVTGNGITGSTANSVQALVSADGNGGWPAQTEVVRQLPAQRHIVPVGRVGEWTLANAANATTTEIPAEAPAPAVGPYALRLFSDAVSGQSTSATKDINLSLNSVAGFWMVLNNRLRTLNGLGITLYFGEAANLDPGSSRFQLVPVTNTQHTGRTAVWVAKSRFTTLNGTPSFANVQRSFRIRLDSINTTVKTMDFEGLFTSTGRPSVLIAFDDGWDTSYTAGHVEARRRGIPLAHFLIGSTLGAANYITLAQAQEMRAQGDYLGLHGLDRWDLDPSRIAADAAALRALGIDTQHGAYPDGQIGDGAAWQATRAALVAAGVKTARLTAAGTAPFSTPCLRGVNDPLTLPAYPLNTWMNVAAAKAAVDEAITSGGTVIFYAHKIAGTADALTYVTADYIELLDYIQQKRLEGLIDTPRWDDWYSGAA